MSSIIQLSLPAGDYTTFMIQRMNEIDISRIVQSVETLYNPSCSSIEKNQASQLLSTITTSNNSRFVATSIMESKDPCICILLFSTLVVTNNSRIFAANMLIDIIKTQWKASPDESVLHILSFAEKYILDDVSVCSMNGCEIE